MEGKFDKPPIPHSIGKVDSGKKSQETMAAKPPVEVASSVLANPRHPGYSADRAVAITIAGDRSALIAAIDGVGSGGEQSAKAADIVQRNLSLSVGTSFMNPPTINQAEVKLKDAIFASSIEIRRLKQQLNNPDLDTTVSAGVLCKSPDGSKKYFVSANVGDSRAYRYRPSTGEIKQLTKDQSYVQRLVDAGLITPDEAFTHPQRNLILKGVGDLRAPKEIDINVEEFLDGDIAFAVSDGVSDNFPPKGLSDAVRTEFQAAFDGKKPDLRKFTAGVAQRAQNIMRQGTAAWAKPDDACVAALRIPRAS